MPDWLGEMKEKIFFSSKKVEASNHKIVDFNVNFYEITPMQTFAVIHFIKLTKKPQTNYGENKYV